MPRGTDLACGIVSDLTTQPAGKGLGLVDDESAVEEVQRLQGRRGNTALGHDQTTIRTVKGPEDAILLHTHLEGIHHAPRIGRPERFLGVVMIDILPINFVQVKARSSTGSIEVAADRQDAVTDAFGFQPTRWETPQ